MTLMSSHSVPSTYYMSSVSHVGRLVRRCETCGSCIFRWNIWLTSDTPSGCTTTWLYTRHMGMFLASRKYSIEKWADKNLSIHLYENSRKLLKFVWLQLIVRLERHPTVSAWIFIVCFLSTKFFSSQKPIGGRGHIAMSQLCSIQAANQRYWGHLL